MKIGKILAVVFLTGLIWVWADLELSDEYTAGEAPLRVSQSIKQSLWVSFGDAKETSVMLQDIVLEGAASKVAEVGRQLSDGSLTLEFFLDPEQEGIKTGEPHSLNVVDFLKRNKEIRSLGLTVKSCEPQTVRVNLEELVEKSLTVKCVDENGEGIRAESIEPDHINMFVPPEWEGERLEARVVLNAQSAAEARNLPFKKAPMIELASGQTRKALVEVEVKMPEEESKLEEYTIPGPTLGLVYSVNLDGKYSVELSSETVPSVVTIRATHAAKAAYEQQDFKMFLYILDDDEKAVDWQSREVIPNFPQDYVQLGEIELKSQPISVRFKLVPVGEVETAPAAGTE